MSTAMRSTYASSAQCAVPDARTTTAGEVVHLVDAVAGSAATLTPVEDRWDVREDSPVWLRERIERVLSAYDEADRPARRRARSTSTTAGRGYWYSRWR
ncbi:hypothetical protein [Streptomyces sp. NPDC048644]|uniref:hypothetical protein n=1 Tax=Streptomyces sp. NPDC048644 TaxID=3365582 RepID=UPI0037213C49